jgi:hypothetical protein
MPYCKVPGRLDSSTNQEAQVQRDASEYLKGVGGGILAPRAERWSLPFPSDLWYSLPSWSTLAIGFHSDGPRRFTDNSLERQASILSIAVSTLLCTVTYICQIHKSVAWTTRILCSIDFLLFSCPVTPRQNCMVPLQKYSSIPYHYHIQSSPFIPQKSVPNQRSMIINSRQ